MPVSASFFKFGVFENTLFFLYTWFVRHASHKGTPQANARCVGLVGLLRSLYVERVKLEANVPKVVCFVSFFILI
jgi:hypothetical protein